MMGQRVPDAARILYLLLFFCFVWFSRGFGDGRPSGRSLTILASSNCAINLSCLNLLKYEVHPKTMLKIMVYMMRKMGGVQISPMTRSCNKLRSPFLAL